MFQMFQNMNVYVLCVVFVLVTRIFMCIPEVVLWLVSLIKDVSNKNPLPRVQSETLREQFVVNNEYK